MSEDKLALLLRAKQLEEIHLILLYLGSALISKVEWRIKVHPAIHPFICYALSAMSFPKISGNPFPALQKHRSRDEDFKKLSLFQVIQL